MSRRLAAVALIALTLTGCEEPIQSTTPEVISAPVPTPEPDAAEAPTEAESADGPAKRRSGSLTAKVMPKASVFGLGWHRDNAAGGAEQGFEGNGSFVHARDPHHASYELLPIGCTNPPPDDLALPMPAAALVGAYRRGPEQAWAIALGFASEADATGWVRGFVEVETDCGRDLTAMTATRVDRPLDAEATIFENTRWNSGQPWSQTLTRNGSTVLFLGSPTPIRQ